MSSAKAMEESRDASPKAARAKKRFNTIDILDPEKEAGGRSARLRPILSGKKAPERRHEAEHELVEKQHRDDGRPRQREGHAEEDGDEP